MVVSTNEGYISQSALLAPPGIIKTPPDFYFDVVIGCATVDVEIHIQYKAQINDQERRREAIRHTMRSFEMCSVG